MANRGCWIEDEWVDGENVVYDIYHENKLVATFATMDEVWSFYGQKKREVMAEKVGNWNPLGIGDCGLTMSNWGSPDEGTTKIVWWTHYRNKLKNPSPSTGRTPNEYIWNPVGENRVEIYTIEGKAYDAE